MVATFKVDDRNLRRRLIKINKDISTNGMSTVTQVAKIMALRAAMLAPKSTGELRRYIRVIPVNKAESKECLVGYENGGMGIGNPHPDRQYSGGEFSLPLWMHTSNKALRHPWKSGIPRFLPAAANQTRNEFNEKIRKVVHNALLYKTK